MKNPIAEAYLKMLQEAKEKKMDPVGKADADIDNDGDVDDSDEYLHNRRKAIKKSMKEEVCGECGKDPCECEDEVDEACGKSKKEAVSIDPDDGEVAKSKDDKKKKKDAEAEVVAEDNEIEEALETDGPRRGKLNMTFAKGAKGRKYQSDKAQQRRDQNAKNDPGAAKKHLALSVTDKKKAAQKAIKKGIKFSPYDMVQGKKPNKMQLIQKGLDPKMARESVELEEGKKLRNVLSDREFEKSMKKALADKSNYKGGKVNWNFIDADVYMELTAKGYDLRHPSINYMDRFDKLADKLDPANVKESIEEKALTVGMKQPIHIDDTEEKGHMDAVKANKAGPGKAKENKVKKLKELRK